MLIASLRWTAVSRGAVLRGIAQITDADSPTARIESRIARASYGTLVNRWPFEKDTDHPEDKEWCPYKQTYFAADQAQWFLRNVRADDRY